MTKYVSPSNEKNGSGRRRGLQKGVHPNVKSEVVAEKLIIKGVAQDDGSAQSTAEHERCESISDVTVGNVACMLGSYWS